MEKAIFFEREDGFMHRCMFAGVDGEGNPQWVIINQVEEVMTLDEYRRVYGFDRDEIVLLCLEGETAESTTIATLLGASIQIFGASVEGLSQKLEQLRKWEVKWHHTPLSLSLNVLKYRNSQDDSLCYRYYIAGSGMGKISEYDMFESLTELLNHVDTFITALRDHAFIPVKSLTFEAPEDVIAEMKPNEREMFDSLYVCN